MGRTMRSIFPDVTGLVLAGGASRRMGEDKAGLLLAGETMIQRQIRLLRSVCSTVAVLGPPEIFSSLDVPALRDELPGLGPLGALYTGLKWTRTDFNLFIGCDLPFMVARFLRYLCQRALDNRADVTVPESRDRRLQTLCAVYRRRAWRVIRTSLEGGEKKVSKIYSRVRCLRIDWPEIVRAGFSARIFDNMNTREDYEAAKRRLSVIDSMSGPSRP